MKLCHDSEISRLEYILDAGIDLVILADVIVDPVVVVGDAVGSVGIEKVALDAIGAAIAALPADGVLDLDVVVGLALLPLPRASVVVSLVVEAGVQRFAARLHEVGRAAAFSKSDFAGGLV